jgi:hypothetical protein
MCIYSHTYIYSYQYPQLLYPSPRGSPFKMSLKQLAVDHLGQVIQDGSEGHDSLQVYAHIYMFMHYVYTYVYLMKYAQGLLISPLFYAHISIFVSHLCVCIETYTCPSTNNNNNNNNNNPGRSSGHIFSVVEDVKRSPVCRAQLSSNHLQSNLLLFLVFLHS